MNPVELWREVVYPSLISKGPEVAYPGVEFRHRTGRQWRGACPFHDGESTSVFVVEVETLRWQCWGGCGGGDPLTYHCGGETPHGQDFTDAVRELAELAGVPWPEDETAARALPRRPPPQPRPVAVPLYPPEGEVRKLLSRSAPVDADREVSDWLVSRGLPPEVVASRDLARALPRGAPCPTWARYREPWSSGPYRLLVPLFDAEGRFRSIHARAVTQVEQGRPKALSTAPVRRPGEEPQKTSCKGLVMADPLGRQVLRAGDVPEWWPLGRRLRVIICEGEPDWLTWATRFGEACTEAPAMFGIIGGGKAGSWTQHLARRIPAGSRVIIRTDCDQTGEKYASAIAATLSSCSVLRRRPCVQAA